LAPPAAAQDVFLHDVTVIDGTGAPPQPHVDVLIAGGRIDAIAPTGSLEPLGTEIDASGLTALPGLIDAHIHFVAASGSNYRHDSDETIRALNRQHLRALVACGVTTVLDAGVYPEVARDIQSWLAAGNPGPRYLTTGPYVRPHNGYGHPRFGEETTPEEVEAKLDVIQSLGASGVKIAFEAGVGPFGGPEPFTPALLTAVVDGARKRGLPLYIHATSEEAQGQALDVGARAIMHATMDFLSPADLSEGFIARLAASGTYQVTTLSLIDTFPGLYDTARLDDPLLRLVVPDLELATARAPDAVDAFYVSLLGWTLPWTYEFTRPWIAHLALSPQRLRNTIEVAGRNLLREHRAGVPIVVGTDAPSPWPDAIYHFHGPQEAREMELLGAAGLPPLAVISAATSTAARMLGLEHEIGTLAVGMAADVVLVEGDPAEDLTALRRVRWTLRNGVAHTPAEWMRVSPP